MDEDLELKKKGEIYEKNDGELIFICCICDATNVGLMEVETHLKLHIDRIKIDEDTFFKTEISIESWPETGQQDDLYLQEQEEEVEAKYSPNAELLDHQENVRIWIEVEPATDTDYNQNDDLRKDNLNQIISPDSIIGDDNDVDNSEFLSKRSNPRKVRGKQPTKKSLFGENKCDICDFIATTKVGLKKHVFARHAKYRPHECDICGHKFADRRNLTEHVNRHNKVKNHSCDICGKAYVTTSELKNHLSVVHRGERNYMCSICGKRYGSSSKRLAHDRRVHTNEQRFKCNYSNCNRGFYTNYNLQIHMRRHTGERPFKCDICKKNFGNPKVLATHILLHNTEKQFHCKFCPSKFSQSSGRRGHERRVHGAV